ncbi:MAG: imelysin family protein [Dongiaceae bacterium]
MRRPSKRVLILVLAVIAVIPVLVASLAPQWLEPPDKAAALAGFNRAYAGTVVVPAFDRLASASAALATTAAEVCAGPDAAGPDAAGPDAAGLDRLATAFAATADAWAGAQQFRLGPLSDQQHADRFAYWPERRNIVDRQLAGLLAGSDAAELSPAAFARQSVAVQGLTALERLLFDDAARQALLAGDAAAARRCAVATAIARNLSAIAGTCRDAWHEAERDPARAAAPFSASAGEAAAQSLGNLMTILEVAADQKIAAPLGPSADQARPKAAEQWRSGRSLRDLRLNLETARRSFAGDAGFATLLAAADPGTGARVAAAFDAVDKALAGVPEPLDRAVADPAGRRALEEARAALKQVEDLLRREAAPAMGITLGFNELDGDGGS